MGVTKKLIEFVIIWIVCEKLRVEEIIIVHADTPNYSQI